MTNAFVCPRYEDDVYDRLWIPDNGGSTTLNWVPINTSSVIDTQDSNDSYQLPAQVLRTAVQPPSGHNALTYNGTYNPYGYDKYYVCFHFAEIAKPTQGKKREFIIDVEGGNYTSEPITLEYLKPLSICPQNGQPFEGSFSFSINATTESGLPPILNAFEVYKVISLPYKPTDPSNVAAIMYIKQTYMISRDDWQGDPCVPHQYSWSNLTCSSDDTPRIISLDLSSSKLIGEIATSISDLTALQYLDLSYNNLTGNVPEFLAQLPNLKILGNHLKGSVPEALIQKSRDGSLVLSYPEVVEITNSFQTIVGEGGFGKVYLGILKDETKVAIKLLSPSSKQGYKEFQAEAQLLMIVHHRNLVSLVGYCDEGEYKALIYEYMANGNLQQHLSDSYRQLTHAFGSRFVTNSRPPQPMSALLSLTMRNDETLKAYSDKYWEIYNELDDKYNDVAINTFKNRLPMGHGLRKSLTGKPATSGRQLMDRIDKYKRVEEDLLQGKGRRRLSLRRGGIPGRTDITTPVREEIS
nr:probable LRR receptor-like serine/threonine-protein kinase At5g59680 [Quercus suber]